MLFEVIVQALFQNIQPKLQFFCTPYVPRLADTFDLYSGIQGFLFKYAMHVEQRGILTIIVCRSSNGMFSLTLVEHLGGR